MEVIVGTSYLYSAYQIHETYKEKGAEAAFEQLGIEIVLNVACQGAFKVAFKVGSKLYPSARAATNAALNNVPRLKHTLGSFTETLIVTGEKLANTGLNAAKKFANTKLVKQTVVTVEKVANIRIR